MGIDTDRVYAFTFSLNAAICGAAGVLIAMIWVIQPFYGITYSIRSFVIVTAAGLGNLPGVIAAASASASGRAEQYSGFVMGAEFQQATPWSACCSLVLIWRQIQQAAESGRWSNDPTEMTPNKLGSLRASSSLRGSSRPFLSRPTPRRSPCSG